LLTASDKIAPALHASALHSHRSLIKKKLVALKVQQEDSLTQQTKRLKQEENNQ